jgi:hypothetical protein
MKTELDQLKEDLQSAWEKIELYESELLYSGIAVKCARCGDVVLQDRAHVFKGALAHHKCCSEDCAHYMQIDEERNGPWY